MVMFLFLVALFQTSEAVFYSCQDIWYANPQSKSGEYIIQNRNHQTYNVWCEFHQNYGYAFVSNMSRVDINVDDLYTDRTRAILRHITTSGVQKEVEVGQLSRYKNQPLAFYYNKYDHYAVPTNEAKLGPYLYLGFLPTSIASARNLQGYKAAGVDYTFTNCDSNPNSYLALFFNSKNSQPVGYFNRCCPSPLITAWSTHSKILSKDRHMPAQYYFLFEMHMGGCGGYEISLQQDFRGVTGAALGYRYELIDPCASMPCSNGATCYPEGRGYQCECSTDAVDCQSPGIIIG